MALQVADLIAGAACILLSARATHSMTEYTNSLHEVGLLEAVMGGAWSSDAVTPEQLETDGPVLSDPAQFIAQPVRAHVGGGTDDD